MSATELDSTATAPPRHWRGVLGWLIVIALVVSGAFLALAVAATAPSAHGGLDPEGRADNGSLALAEILDRAGVDVDVQRSRAAAARAIDDDTTLVLTNPYALSDEAVDTLFAAADRIVLLSAGTHLLDHLDLGETAVGTASPVAAECDVPEFAKVGAIRPDRLFSPADGVTACFDGAVLVDDQSTQRISVVDGTNLFSNAYLAENGNAALALALLGQTSKVVWYVPSFADSDIQGEQVDTLGDLTPGWVTPAILLLIVAGIVAGIWRGRRFGPLVAETLPVTVRASETMHGRARLTAKAGDSAHAAAAIRDGVRRRLARRLGLHARATVDEVADAASDRLRIPRGTLQTLLDGALPTTDADLVDLARRLGDLEDALDADAHRPPPSPTENEGLL